MAVRGTGETVFGLKWSWDRFVDAIANDYKIQDRKTRLYLPWGPLFAQRDYQMELAKVVFEELSLGGPANIVGVKARKAGFSTFASGLAVNLSHNLGWQCGIMGHEEETTEYIFEIAKTIHEQMPADRRPETRYSKGTNLQFRSNMLDGGEGGRISCATAGGHHPFTARTLSMLVMDESAKYPGDDEQQNKLIASVMGTRSIEGPSLVMKFSTANGASGDFYETAMEAYDAQLKGKRSDWRLFFFPWFRDRGNALPVEPDYDWADWAPEDREREKQLVQLYSLTPEQLRFRRLQIKLLRGNADLFDQEYPSTVRGAFRTNDKPAIPREVLNRLELGILPSLGRFRLGTTEEEGDSGIH
jgi:hypothetical protein